MRSGKSPLDGVRVAAPCSVGWENMVGTDRVRFCGQCQLNVYNLSDMTRNEAERLISESEGRLCVRYYRRADGTILTRNCPVGLRALRRRLSRVAAATATAVLSFITGLLAATGFRDDSKLSKASAATPNAEIKIRSIPEPRVTVGMLQVRRDDEGWVEGRVSVDSSLPIQSHGKY